MIDWKRETVANLKEFPDRKAGIENASSRIEMLRAEAVSIRSATTDGQPVKGSGISSREDRLISNIVERQQLEQERQYSRAWIRWMEGALAQLTDEERLILDRFYMHRQRGGLDQLCQDLGLLDMSSLYRRKDRALRRLTLLLYGSLST